MKPAMFLVALGPVCSVSLLLSPACKKAEKTTETAESTQPSAPGASKPVAGHGDAPTQATGSGMAGSGTVSETMNAGGYTYVKLDGSQGQVWAAAPETTVKVGDEVSFASGMPMQNFRSNTLDRTFELVYFVPGLTIGGAAQAPAQPHAAVGGADAGAAATLDISGLSKPKGGKTVAEVFAGKDALSGKEVVLRGKVVKYNGGIMGRNWLHVRDGSGAEGTNDLTVTTSGTAAVGDTVLLKGKLTLDKDFGAGYQYDVIVEDAAITIE